MKITHAELKNFRALKTISIPLNQFSVLIGENDVGKTSFLFALEIFFVGKKLNQENDWFKKEIEKDIEICLTFSDLPDEDSLDKFKTADGQIKIHQQYSFNKPPVVQVIMEDKSKTKLPKALNDAWFSANNFHFIPVRRDIELQFSMKKTALLGKTFRAKMEKAIQDGEADKSLLEIQEVLKLAIDKPRADLQNFLQEQMHNEKIKLTFDDLLIDPIEGVSFGVNLSDDRVEGTPIQNRGAGTQNNLIIALFRLIATMEVAGNFIFAMEEPENSLHPKAQRHLLSVIQEISKTSQVILTTHSPVFIERTKFENNIILTRQTSGSTIAKTFNKEMLTDLRIDLGIRPSDALLSGGGNCAILVEGNSEENGFPIFMEMCGMSEFQLGISIVNMRGPTLERLANTARLLLSYEIPCVVVLDKNKESEAKDLEREAKASLPNLKKYFCFK